jgi:hypothetical protein
MMTILVLFLGWLCFVFAVVNMMATVHRYIRCETSSTGFEEFVRMFIWALALTIWYYLVF